MAYTHISGHPSATSRAQDSESTSAEDQCSTAGPRNQPMQSLIAVPNAILYPLGATVPNSYHLIRLGVRMSNGGDLMALHHVRGGGLVRQVHGVQLMKLMR